METVIDECQNVSFHICCLDREEYSDLIGSDINVFSVGINLYGLISVLCLMYQMRKRANHIHMLSFYENIILSQAVTFIAIMSLNLMSSIFNENTSVLVVQIIGFISVLLVGSQWFAQISIIVFMFQKNIQRKYTIYTVVTTSVITFFSLATLFIFYFAPEENRLSIGMAVTESLMALGHFGVFITFFKFLSIFLLPVAV
eukprot:TRINITY_DN9553_c0_g1_i1.p1 TRINITY_DN9553_c0_g1~~TRINITY_DN9553_c0_g1_i1.p1  ORF type:complete len:200 (-),score=13.73 TRINITY_DN9553_c0_g1_i1:20-619(-)